MRKIFESSQSKPTFEPSGTPGRLWDPSGTLPPQTSGTACGTLLGRLLGRLKSQKNLGNHDVVTLVTAGLPLCAHEHSGTLRASRFAPFPQSASRSPRTNPKYPAPFRTIPQFENFFPLKVLRFHRPNGIRLAVNCTYLRQIKQENFCAKCNSLKTWSSVEPEEPIAGKIISFLPPHVCIPNLRYGFCHHHFIVTMKLM